MQKKLKMAVMALCYAPLAMAQTDSIGQAANVLSEAAITFTEAQLGEDEDMSQNLTIVHSNSNIYASEVGYLFSPVRFRYRAFDQKYNGVYINGLPMNDMESGQFRYSLVGGLNQQTRNMESTLPFESNSFAMADMGGANNYNFRPAAMPVGQRITLSGANRSYMLRGMYTFNTGLSNKGWAFSGNITYRWANRGYVEGTFYNSLSYFLGIQKVFADGAHSIALSTWGNPTERASQGAGTDEMYWLANDRYYNPYWGYQNGKKRNSRVVNDFAPTAILTWDWKISEKSKLTTSLLGKYAMYKSTKLDYNNAENPHPNYWKNMPSSYYDVWNSDNNSSYRTAQCLSDWNTAVTYWQQSKENRQIDFDRLYYANKQASAQGADAMYFIQAKHNNALAFTLASTWNKQISKNQAFNLGLIAATTKGMHYTTMDDLLGASVLHNINTYAVGTYALTDNAVQYDLNNPNAAIHEGDRFRYDYNIFVHNAKLWTSYSENFGNLHYTIAGRLGYTAMQREGKMRNGLAANNSFGKSHTAQFLDGGIKASGNIDLGRGNTLTLGMGYELRAPQASKAFAAPEINNDFVLNLKNERVFSSELGYQLQTSWLHANVNAYYSRITNGTDWQNYYFDDINSFTYVSMTDQKKEYYGIEAGLKFKITSFLDINLLGTISEAKLVNDSKLRYMKSTTGSYNDGEVFDNGSADPNPVVHNKGMRDSGTPLTAASLGVSYHQGGWYIDLNCNYYDRIYLSYSPSYRYSSTLRKRESILSQNGEHVFDNDGTSILPEAVAQAKGHGGFMLDASIGRSIYLKRGSLSINLSITNILNNQNIVTGGYEQSRSDYTTSGNTRAYSFSKNPMKFYAYGTNGMLNIAYKF